MASGLLLITSFDACRKKPKNFIATVAMECLV